MLTCALATALCAPAFAHLAVSTRSLRDWVNSSDLVVRARLLPRDQVPAERGPRPITTVAVREVLKGPEVSGRLRFVQHGHGVVSYPAEGEALIFLRDIAKSRELKRLGAADVVRWYSEQEHSDDYRLTPRDREATLDAVREYVRIARAPSEERLERLRRVTVSLLVSGDQRLAESALRDLVQMPNVPVVTKAEVPVLTGVIEQRTQPIGVRVGLLSELVRRRLVDGARLWVMLLRSTSPPDLQTVMRAARNHQTKPVTNALIALLDAPDPQVAAEAAIALGARGNDLAVAPLARALTRPERRVAMASIRALGQIATPAAHAEIDKAAKSHPDPGVKRRAAAELVVLKGERGQTSARPQAPD